MAINVQSVDIQPVGSSGGRLSRGVDTSSIVTGAVVPVGVRDVVVTESLPQPQSALEVTGGQQRRKWRHDLVISNLAISDDRAPR